MPESTTTHVWLALDPETRRVLVQSREWGDGDFPPGLRGLDWPRRELDVDQADLDAILAGSIDFAAVDQLHRSWWNEAGPEDGPQWPDLP